MRTFLRGNRKKRKKIPKIPTSVPSNCNYVQPATSFKCQDNTKKKKNLYGNQDQVAEGKALERLKLIQGVKCPAFFDNKVLDTGSSQSWSIKQGSKKRQQDLEQVYPSVVHVYVVLPLQALFQKSPDNNKTVNSGKFLQIVSAKGVAFGIRTLDIRFKRKRFVFFEIKGK